MPTISELRALLKAKGIRGYSGKNKAELEAMLAGELLEVENMPAAYPVLTDHLYEETISEIVRVAKVIQLAQTENIDGRIDSAIQEIPFLKVLSCKLLEEHPTWTVIISPPRAPCDIMINSIRINLKLSACVSANNSANKPSFYYSITGLTNYPYSSNWNDFFKRLVDAKTHNQIKKKRNRQTEYHYLVKNKLTGDVLLKPIFDIHTYISDASNDLQINWKNEFIHREYVTSEEDYLKKVESLLVTIQKSIKEMIERTHLFVEADMESILT